MEDGFFMTKREQYVKEGIIYSDNPSKNHINVTLQNGYYATCGLGAGNNMGSLITCELYDVNPNLHAFTRVSHVMAKETCGYIQLNHVYKENGKWRTFEADCIS